MGVDEATGFPDSHRALHGLFNRLDHDRHEGRPLEAFVEAAFNSLRTELRLRAVLVYAERREWFELRRRLGDPGGDVAETLDLSDAALAEVLRHRVYIFGERLDGAAPWLSGSPGSQAAAGLVVGGRPHRHVMVFLLDEGWPREPVDFALNILRAAFALHVLEERQRRDVQLAREIQDGLLVDGSRSLPGFESACRSTPAEVVGGDFLDFVSLGPDVLGLAVGDASGHGLPAALLVRDVVTGLRMGLERHLRMEHVIAKLNRVIHRGSPLGRYVGLFYAECESNGNLSYVNAGLQPPLLVRPDRVQELRLGGPVVGALPHASYRRGLVRLDPGCLLLAFTDGLVERRSPSGEFFGEQRVIELARRSPRWSARELVEAVFEEARQFGGETPWEDDVTLLVLRRQAEA